MWKTTTTAKKKEHKPGTRRFSNHESRLLSRAHTFAIIVILDLKIHQSMWIHWSFFPKTWTKGHWPLHDLWPHVCWGHMCDSTQGSLCPSPMTIHQCMWIQWSILQITTCIHILRFGGTRNSETSLNSHTGIWIQGRGVCEFRYPFVVLNFSTHWNNSAHNLIRSRTLPYVC